MGVLMRLWFSKVGRIAGTSRHPQPRPSLHQVWHIRASMFNQDQPRDSKNVPTVLQSQTQDMPSCCFNHGGGRRASTWGKFTEFYWFYGSFHLAKKKSFLTESTLNRLDNYMEACEPQMYYLSSLLSFKKQIFAEKQRPEICLRFTS